MLSTRYVQKKISVETSTWQHLTQKQGQPVSLLAEQDGSFFTLKQDVEKTT